MVAQIGEDVASALFADIHYYFISPNIKPAVRRFEKNAYVYILDNAAERRSRLEVANSPGTSVEDGFTGMLDNVTLEYSFDHSCLVTLNIPADPSGHEDIYSWHLTKFDQYTKENYTYKIRAMDLYFHSQDDAFHFVDAARRVLPEHQVHIFDDMESDAPRVSAPKTHVLVGDPAGRAHQAVADMSTTHVPNAYILPARTHETVSEAPRSSVMSIHDPHSLPGPPPMPSESSIQPLAYNPAAPAAPEAVVRREKTPPPLEEEEAGHINRTPSISAFNSNRPQPYETAPSNHSPYFAGPPQVAASTSTHHIVSPPATVMSNTIRPAFTHSNTAFLIPPGPEHSDFRSGLQSPPLTLPNVTTSLENTVSSSATEHGLSALSSQPRSLSTYSYDQVRPSETMHNQSLHHQVYTPTKEESRKGAVEAKGKLEVRADRLERGVSGFLKKLEKKYL